jgi:hypothetical protein
MVLKEIFMKRWRGNDYNGYEPLKVNKVKKRVKSCPKCDWSGEECDCVYTNVDRDQCPDFIPYTDI